MRRTIHYAGPRLTGLRSEDDVRIVSRPKANSDFDVPQASVRSARTYDSDYFDPYYDSEHGELGALPTRLSSVLALTDRRRRLTVSRGARCGGQLRRSRDARVDNPCMDARALLGDRPARPQPILLLSIPFCICYFRASFPI